MTSRRRALQALSASIGAIVAAPNFAQSKPILGSVPLVGHTTETSAILWFQFLNAKSVELQVRASNGKPIVTRPVSVSQSSDGVCTVTIDKLSPGTHYEFEIFDSTRSLAPAQRFRTARYEVHDFGYYMGSCHQSDGASATGSLRIFDVMAAGIAQEKAPHFMLWLGDNLYLRRESSGQSADYDSPARMARRYRDVRGMNHLQKLFAATHHYAIWDDHDYGPNNADRTFEHKETSLSLFKQYWPNPPMRTLELPGTYCKFTQGDAEFFLLDDRFYRDAETDAPSPTKQMFGSAQLDWLKSGLANSKANFKIVANGSQLLSELPNGNHSGWHSYKTERDAFLDWLAHTRIGGLVLLSGDRHNTQVFKLDREGQHPVYELAISPFTSRISKLSKAEKANPRLVKPLVVEAHNFGSISFVGAGKDRRAIARCFDVDGKRLWEQVVA